jgi:two-component system nitrate/nitrite response regulator NarL
MTELRVLVIAENLLVRAGLVTLLSREADITVVGQVAGGESLANDLEVYRPDLMIWDFGWQQDSERESFIHLVDEIGAENLLPVLILLPDDSRATEMAALLRDAPAGGLLLRDSGPDQLGAALNATALGLLVFDPALAALPAADTLSEPLLDNLTPREMEVLQLLAEGLANKMIAQQLGISEHTVKFHVNAILSKFNAQSRTEAVVRATRLGLIFL